MANPFRFFDSFPLFSNQPRVSKLPAPSGALQLVTLCRWNVQVLFLFMKAIVLDKLSAFNSPRGLFIVCSIVYITAAVFSKGAFHADEHFQVLEFANWKMGNIPASALTWEFRQQMRPAVQPAIACAVWQAMDAMDVYTPFRLATVLRILSAILTLAIAGLFWHRAKKEFPFSFQIRALLLFGIWFSIYCGVRFSSENWSGLTFAGAFALVVWPPERRKAVVYLFAGLLLGLSFMLRFQCALLVGGLGLWLLFVQRLKWSSLLVLAAGALLAVGMAVLTDRWFYGQWVNTAWNYFNQNIVLGKVNSFGTHPWYNYFTDVFLRGIPPISIVVIAAVVACIVLKPRHALSFTLIPYLLVHFIIAHKEMRFMFSIVPLVPLAMAVAYNAAKQRNTLRLCMKSRAVKWIMRITLALNFFLVGYVVFFSGNRKINVLQKVYDIQESGPVTMYFAEPSPLHGNEITWFYRGKNMNTLLLTDADFITLQPMPGDYIIVPIQKDKNMDRLRSRVQEEYISLPKWLFRFNINNWTQRSTAWRVYRVTS